MNDRLQREVAWALETDEELLPFMPQLLADLAALGSPPEIVVAMLRPLALPARSTEVIDLGCGKGAIAIALAKELGFSVVGLDAFAPFVEEARAAAAQAGVSSQCRFHCADLRQGLENEACFDLVVYASVGVLGPPQETVARLRPVVRPGGYLLIDDAFVNDSAREEALRLGYRPRAETVAALTSHGDALIQEYLFTPQLTAALNRYNTEHIRIRAQELARRHPGHAKALLGFVARQEVECKRLETVLTPAIWLLQRREP